MASPLPASLLRASPEPDPGSAACPSVPGSRTRDDAPIGFPLAGRAVRTYVRNARSSPEAVISQPIPTDPPEPLTLSGPRRGDTRLRLLDAAERLFAERGFEGTSMRALARAAGASLSSTNYHFGTKEALLEAALRRRAGPVNALRLARLDEAEATAGDSPVALETILDAFVRPLFEVRAARGADSARPGWVAARLFLDPAPLVTRIRADLFSEVDGRFLAALERALPGRVRRKIEIAYQLTNGLLSHVAAGRVLPNEPDTPSQRDPEAVLLGLLAYATAGLRNLERGDAQ